MCEERIQTLCDELYEAQKQLPALRCALRIAGRCAERILQMPGDPHAVRLLAREIVNEARGMLKENLDPLTGEAKCEPQRRSAS